MYNLCTRIRGQVKSISSADHIFWPFWYCFKSISEPSPRLASTHFQTSLLTTLAVHIFSKSHQTPCQLCTRPEHAEWQFGAQRTACRGHDSVLPPLAQMLLLGSKQHRNQFLSLSDLDTPRLFQLQFAIFFPSASCIHNILSERKLGIRSKHWKLELLSEKVLCSLM